MAVRVIGAATVAAEFAAAAATVRAGALKDSLEAATALTEDWQNIIPPSPGGYEGAGFTSSPGANRTQPIDDGPMVGAEAYNQSFVASFLQGGTAHHGPKVDLLGAADRHIDGWIDAVADRAGL